MQKRRFTALIAGLAASAALGLSMPASAQQYKDEYKLSTVLGEAFPWGWGAKRWADLVAEKTEGRIKIKVYPGTSLVSGDHESFADLEHHMGRLIAFLRRTL